ncbi:MAG TPA: hypothetical protein VK752_15495 [Bryobacteraceae bacterium]|nr:hypothetical protein [Bryobacteraceae bacterium]
MTVTLSERYDHFNALAFGSWLRSSKDVEIRFVESSEMVNPLSRGEFTATYEDNALGDVVASYNFRILVNSNTPPGDINSVLLHEMIHSEIAQQLHTEEAHNKDMDNHSPRFEKRAAEIEKLTGEKIVMPDVVARELHAVFTRAGKAQEGRKA